MIKIKLEKFEGPLSLLLRLIEKEELDVTQISLATVADQFVNYIRNSQNISPEEMADFLVVASRLLFIKSKALLPYIFPEDEEEIEEFEQQLKMYQEFLVAAKKINKILGKGKFMFAREFNRKVVLSNVNLFSPPKNLEKKEMFVVFNDLLNRLQPPEKLEEEILDKKVNIEDQIMVIQRMVLDKIKVSFNKIIKESKNKTEVIVNFLAVLELMRQRQIELNQDELFGDIIIKRSSQENKSII